LTKIEACLAITKKINRKSKIVVGVTSSHELAEIYSGLRKKIPSKVSVDHLSIDDENLTNPTYWIIK